MSESLPLPKDEKSSQPRQRIFAFLLLVAAVLLGLFWFINKNSNQKTLVTTFEQCVSAGYPVAESFPRQCRMGKVVFVEDVDGTKAPEQVVVPELAAGAAIQSPVNLSGQAVGGWFFEGSFPVKLFDSQGRELASGVATALADWMSEGYVPFTVSLEYQTPTTPDGYVEFYKDNPSGLPENDAVVRMQVRFAPEQE